ncbi:peptidylprolyl isomerase [Robiginitalea marina]|uniref:Peptidyl-prolyl cis-trans isomerase n=1 Tax=Robiginitalea marina TaxID=2954105 RepID=A0ABT1AXA9_9FLAO|nr:peptidylprolyl isomerase [Robiginitalea marina]MCO5723838.1 peptidylprolyl isomerase [Robiginitalea marina]
MLKRIALFSLLLLAGGILGCGEQSKEKPNKEPAAPQASDSLETAAGTRSEKSEKEAEEPFVLTEENAIDFFFDYQKNLKANRVRLTTSLGSFTIALHDNVPYHKANFIYLTRKGYFDNTMFHRVVRGFIIQGGNADNRETARKRTEIGRYLLPPDTRKGYRHHRGTVSMPSSEINNPHMLASPYEFFIVVTDPGSYHLDGDYTPFGKVVEGMDVVDRINQVPVDDGDWPSQNVYILKAEVLD